MLNHFAEWKFQILKQIQLHHFSKMEEIETYNQQRPQGLVKMVIKGSDRMIKKAEE